MLPSLCTCNDESRVCIVALSRPLLRLVCPRRARLYRVVGAEWKQRGTGDIKILKHKTTGRFRVVMRQEKTLKLVANHRFDTASTLVRLSCPTAALIRLWIWEKGCTV